MGKKIFENDRHKVYRDSGAGLFESLINSAFGIKDPVKIQVYDKKTKNWGTGVDNNTRQAESRAYRDLRSKNNR